MDTNPPPKKSRSLNRLNKRLRLWARRFGLARKMTYSLAVLAVLAGIATVATMTGAKTTELDPDVIVGLLYLDAVLLLGLGAVVARRLTVLWSERRRGKAGSGLHSRLVLLFSVVAVTPAILVAVFSALFMNYGVQAWFSERVQTALQASGNVATAYLREHRLAIHADALSIANILNKDAAAFVRDKGLFKNALTQLADLHSLSEALVIDGSGKTLAHSTFSLSLSIDLIPTDIVRKAGQGQIADLTTNSDDRVRAAIKLNRFVDAYLIVGRFVDARVLEHIDLTTSAVQQYQKLEQSSRNFQITFVMIFAVVALLLLMVAVWVGLTVATRLVRPISGLVSAADRVGKGDLHVRVDPLGSSDEIGTLSRAFNRMTSQLDLQQEGLREANRQLDERRRFTETVLSGVSAGVIGLDSDGRIHLPNRSAETLLGADLSEAEGTPLSDVVPEMKDLLNEVVARPDQQRQAEIKIVRKGKVKTLVVGIAAERLESDIIGYVVTFDDVTDLVSAQRTAAWADVARRIAHEIKNPLTPIQLSAERLKRRYLKEIESDPAVFVQCTDTIIRQVGDIGRMVDEFSSFARMPQAVLKPENLSELCRQAVFLERNRSADIEIEARFPDTDLTFRCDARQMGRALTNLLKNAVESVSARVRNEDENAVPGHVCLRLSLDGTSAVILDVSDNGLGLPEEHLDRLTEPYVTTRDDGTGLGLAIVKKIAEDHGGDLVLENNSEGGARVSLVMPFVSEAGSVEKTTDAKELTSTVENSAK